MMGIEQKLIQLYTSWCGKAPLSLVKLPGSGSYRSYYRLRGTLETVIGAHNGDVRENEVFISFTGHFRREGLPVPEILANDPEGRVYLLSDLGDTTLYQLLTQKRAGDLSGSPLTRQEGEGFPSEVMEIYKKVLGWLPVFQVKAGQKLNYELCYPRAAFDRQSMMWDLNYFKYYFLKLAKIPFEEQALEDDFTTLCDILLQADAGFFLYRDFQSRNIMVVNGEPWFIDYQGGRKGALQYDIASLLTDGKADIPIAVRQQLLHYYLDKLGELFPVDRENFLRIYHGFALIRILQAMGAYGFRGYYEQKPHFLQSIPFALRNLQYLRANKLIGSGLDTLMEVIDRMVDTRELYNPFPATVNDSIPGIYPGDSPGEQSISRIYPEGSPGEQSISRIYPGDPSQKLTVTIRSFSYKKRIPIDENGNGGGFMFDCRALPNPGRFDEFRQLNGKDQPVIDFLEKEQSVSDFLGHVRSLADQSVSTYLSRGFEHLMVSFGCTGGQHRSVYCAEKLAKHLKTKFKISIILIHLEQTT